MTKGRVEGKGIKLPRFNIEFTIKITKNSCISPTYISLTRREYLVLQSIFCEELREDKKIEITLLGASESVYFDLMCHLSLCTIVIPIPAHALSQLQSSRKMKVNIYIKDNSTVNGTISTQSEELIMIPKAVLDPIHSKPHKFSVCTVMKNEQDYVKE